MSLTKFGINGFGRIGRLVFRAAMSNPKVEVTAINEPFMDTDYLIYNLRYDTVHGRFKGTIEKDGQNLIVNGKKIQVFHEKDPASIPWGKAGSDIICESTGVFLTQEKAQAHLKGGTHFHVRLTFRRQEGHPFCSPQGRHSHVRRRSQPHQLQG
jgi:glyceraldehyde 3-phosphate dehydrogenase